MAGDIDFVRAFVYDSVADPVPAAVSPVFIAVIIEFYAEETVWAF